MPELKSSLVAGAAAVSVAAAFSLVTPMTVQSQPTTVGPDKPVLVINPTSHPVPVVEVDKVTSEPFQVTAEINEGFDVPEGKLLVIEFVSGRVDLSPATCPAGAVEIGTTVDGKSANHFFNLTPIVTASLSKIQSVSTVTHLYAEGKVFVANDGFGGGCTVSGRIAFSGHLEELP